MAKKIRRRKVEKCRYVIITGVILLIILSALGIYFYNKDRIVIRNGEAMNITVVCNPDFGFEWRVTSTYEGFGFAQKTIVFLNNQTFKNKEGNIADCFMEFKAASIGKAELAVRYCSANICDGESIIVKKYRVIVVD